MKAVLERIEGNRAIIVVDRNELPSDAKEGDHLTFTVVNGEIVAIEIDHEATEATRQRIEEKMDRLRRGDHLEDEE